MGSGLTVAEQNHERLRFVSSEEIRLFGQTATACVDDETISVALDVLEDHGILECREFLMSTLGYVGVYTENIGCGIEWRHGEIK